MSEFNFSTNDLAGENDFLLKAGELQTNKTAEGREKPLVTTQSEGKPKDTLSIVSLSDAVMGSPGLKPEGARTDMFNRVGQDAIASLISENGGPHQVLGGTLPVSPNDLILKASLNIKSSESLLPGSTGSANVNMGAYPPPSGTYRSNDAMRSIYSIDTPGKTPPYGNQGLIVPFKWWNGQTYQVHVATVKVWALMDNIMKKYNYGPRPEETGGGGYNRRRITNGADWSLHAYGIAVDINPTKNPYGPRFISDMPADMVEEILEIKTTSGLRALRWGGHYKNNKDAMHYEVMITPQEIEDGLSIGGRSSSNIPSRAR